MDEDAPSDEELDVAEEVEPLLLLDVVELDAIVEEMLEITVELIVFKIVVVEAMVEVIVDVMVETTEGGCESVALDALGEEFVMPVNTPR